MAEGEQYGMGRKRVPSQKAGMGRETQLGTAARGLLGRPVQSGEVGGAGVYPKMPPMVEAMTMPRITQQMMIMIFFCRETKAGLRRAWGYQKGGARMRAQTGAE